MIYFVFYLFKKVITIRPVVQESKG